MDIFLYKLQGKEISFSLNKNLHILRILFPNTPQVEYAGLLINEALRTFPKASFSKIINKQNDKFIILTSDTKLTTGRS